MKVRPGGCALKAEAGGLSSFPSGASSGCWAAHAPDLPPAGPRCLRSESFGLRWGRGSLLWEGTCVKWCIVTKRPEVVGKWF